MSEDAHRQRCLWRLAMARGLGYGGLLLTLFGLFVLPIPIVPRLYLLGVALMLVALVMGVPASRRVRRLSGQEGTSAGGTGWAVGGLALGFALALSAPFLLSWLLPSHIWPGRHDARRPHRAICLSNTKNLALALQMYVQENDDVFPPAAGRCDSLGDYVKDESVFQCPEAPDLRCAYAYNRALGGASMSDLADPVTTVAIFESAIGWNAAGDASRLTAVLRHLDGDNYGFADGHASWVKREDLSLGRADLHWPLEREE